MKIGKLKLDKNAWIVIGGAGSAIAAVVLLSGSRKSAAPAAAISSDPYGLSGYSPAAGYAPAGSVTDQSSSILAAISNLGAILSADSHATQDLIAHFPAVSQPAYVAPTVVTPVSAVPTNNATVHAPIALITPVPISVPLPPPAMDNPISAPVTNAPSASVIVSSPPATPATSTSPAYIPYATPGGAVAPGQQVVATITGSGGLPISIFGRTP